ncbi:gamma-glutamylcyclotransferase [Pararhodobacter marinus]|uniref:Gamma-glutamylcyclotransferase n=1 Tax=Pararhodobacter marinus TaxID=2184063 RepID=A0A2U2CCL7_9RHOB|nr:gamma-glutamylcyclotransferase family protein [Pararhodobacter marinus]PWE29638.1 gamma-glutamylcyclotransferase [Pararhodobacter marinus]
MSEPYFFGYGSLVNRQTHIYTPAYRARLSGWRRAWKHTQGRVTPFLTGIRDEGSAIDGLVAHVPGGDWAALDLREEGYDRHAIPSGLVVEGDPALAAQVYAVPVVSMVVQDDPAPILLSYLDVVVQGYLREFGEVGAHDFFATTDGWDTPVLDDRAAPRYPRAQVLTGSETAFVDARLTEYGVRVV